MLYQAPSPQRKKDPPARENKLRLFLKRSSEPLLNLQNAAQQVIKRVNFRQLWLLKSLKQFLILQEKNESEEMGLKVIPLSC